MEEKASGLGAGGGGDNVEGKRQRKSIKELKDEDNKEDGKENQRVERWKKGGLLREREGDYEGGEGNWKVTEVKKEKETVEVNGQGEIEE